MSLLCNSFWISSDGTSKHKFAAIELFNCSSIVRLWNPRILSPLGHSSPNPKFLHFHFDSAKQSEAQMLRRYERQPFQRSERGRRWRRVLFIHSLCQSVPIQPVESRENEEVQVLTFLLFQFAEDSGGGGGCPSCQLENLLTLMEEQSNNRQSPELLMVNHKRGSSRRTRMNRGLLYNWQIVFRTALGVAMPG